MTKRIVGYANEISAVPGQALDFMISCFDVDNYTVDIVRLIHGDLNPAGPGFKSEAVSAIPAASYRGREQAVHSGSYGTVRVRTDIDVPRSITLQATVWPTTPGRGVQTIMSWAAEDCRCELILDEEGSLAGVFKASGRQQRVSSGVRLIARRWYCVGATFDADTGEVNIYQNPIDDLGHTARAHATARLEFPFALPSGGTISLAASFVGEATGRTGTADHYNGKIEYPQIAASARTADEIAASTPGDPGSDLFAGWDFSIGINGIHITDVSHNGLHGVLINLPVRAMKGSNWTGEELCWSKFPTQYGAIHFHDDDVYDAAWDVDFSVTLPSDLRSGVYAAHLQAHDAEDYIPFFVRPADGAKRADIVFVAPTASYLAYANEHMPTDAPLAQLLTDQVIPLQEEDLFLLEHREYGGSTYDTHTDGSGICYSSRLRPILNMRPKYADWLGGSGSALWQFNADLHITDWLEHEGFAFDVITDEDLHRDGIDLLSQYRAVITGTHPEYTSASMRRAYASFTRGGGRLLYMGGNGFYWRTSYSTDLPGVIEVRKGEGGIRAWAAEPGEYYNAFTGEYSGLWRRSGFAPQELVGVGFTSQGFDVSSYYVRQVGSRDPRADFVFRDIGDEERLGDFGLIGGGASGLEIDRADPLLGTPPHALVLASSEGHTDTYLVVLEEILINQPGLTGTMSPLVRADMVFFETPGGGAVFSTGSIAYCGSLSNNDYKNNISRVTSNVLSRFADEEPFTMPDISAWPA